MAKIESSSWETMTKVVPRLWLISKIRSSSRLELTGSKPAEGSSKYRISGSSAKARASPARFFIPPPNKTAQSDQRELEINQFGNLLG